MCYILRLKSLYSEIKTFYFLLEWNECVKTRFFLRNVTAIVGSVLAILEFIQPLVLEYFGCST